MSASIESKRPLFISYRRSDDEPPPKSRATGSISYFVDQLRYKLNDFGVSADRLWIDRNKLEPADEFTAVIKEQLEKTDILVAITSHGYASSGWCWEEVEYFANRLSAFPDHDRRRRIFRVDRHEVDNAELPKPLTGVQAVHLYKHDREAGHGREYYSRGKLTHKALYYDAIDKLAASIAKRIRELGLVERTKGPGFGEDQASFPEPPDDGVKPVEETRPVMMSNGRTVYVAVPEFDLEDQYTTLVTELRNRGYTVLPDGDLPLRGQAALKTIRDGLAQAELSIHMLGEKRGFQPEELDDGIVPLQLAEAAAQAHRDGAFQRLVWAPKIMPDGEGPAVIRDPLGVLSRFGDSLATDEVESDTAARFCDVVIDTLRKRGQVAKSVAAAAAKPPVVYLAFTSQDQALAMETNKRLKQGGIKLLLSPNNASANLASRADHLVVCWGGADDIEVLDILDSLADGEWRQHHPNGKLLLLSFDPESVSQQIARDSDSFGAADAVLDGNDAAALAAVLSSR